MGPPCMCARAREELHKLGHLMRQMIICVPVLARNCAKGPPRTCARNNKATMSHRGINVLPKTCALRFDGLLFHALTFYDYTHLACVR
jgi:hypothetical protein